MADKKISEFDNAGTLTGNEIVPILQGGTNKKTIISNILALFGGGGGTEVSDSAKRTALKLSSNWVNPLVPLDPYYPIMTLNLPTGQSEHDYYIGYDSATNTFYRYVYEKIDGTLGWTRWTSAFNVPV